MGNFYRLLMIGLLLILAACNDNTASVTNDLEGSATRNNIIEEDTETFTSRINLGKGCTGSGKQSIEKVTSPVREGTYSAKHTVDKCGERAELAKAKTEIGGTYWYGWSLYIPEEWSEKDTGWEIINQWAAYPTPRSGKFACGANGHYIGHNTKDGFVFALQYPTASKDSECTKYKLATVSELKGKWVDFVINAKWTGNTDGFFKLWMKIGDGDWVSKADYKGSTWWNDEGDGPYFKTGMYKGDPDWDGPSPRVIYSDAYRLGNSKATFADVSPDGSSLTGGTPAPTEPAPTEPAPTEPAPTEPAPTEPAPTEPAPTEPAPINGKLLGVLDAETGNFSQWRNPDGGGSGNHSIVNNPVFQGKHAFKWTYKGRTESASDYYPTNTDLWISWKLWVPKDFNDTFKGSNQTQGLSVSQFAGARSCNGNDKLSIAMLRVKEGQFFWWLKFWGGIEGVYNNLGSVPKEQWIDLMVNFKLTDKNDGYFRFWINGEQKLDLKGSTWPCMSEGGYFKMGTYAFGYEDGDYILGDNIRIGTSRAAVGQ
jgi:hypothetical protein